MGKLRVYWLKTLNKLSIYPLGNTPSAPSVSLSQVAKATRLVEDDGAQSTSVLHSELQSWIPLFFAHVVMDDTATKGSALVRIEVMARQFATSHPTDGVDEIPAVQVFEPVLIQVMRVGAAVEVVSRRILTAFLVTSVLSSKFSTRVTTSKGRLT